MPHKPKVMLVRDLMEILSELNPGDTIYFGNGDLSYYRTKERGNKLVNLEFNEAYIVTSDPGADSR